MPARTRLALWATAVFALALVLALVLRHEPEPSSPPSGGDGSAASTPSEVASGTSAAAPLDSHRATSAPGREPEEPTRLNVQVTDPEGVPLGGWNVAARLLPEVGVSRASRDTLRETTDALGEARFVLALPPFEDAVHRLHASLFDLTSRKSRRAASEPFVLRRGTRHRITLVLSPLVEATRSIEPVLDRPRAEPEPLPNAGVALITFELADATPEERERLRDLDQARVTIWKPDGGTDDDAIGPVSLDSPTRLAARSGDTIHVVARGFAEVPSLSIEFPFPGAQVPVRVALSRGGRLEVAGRYRDGTPIGLPFDAVLLDAPYDQPHIRLAFGKSFSMSRPHTSGRDLAVIQGVPAGRYRLRAAGFEREARVTDGETTRWELTLPIDAPRRPPHRPPAGDRAKVPHELAQVQVIVRDQEGLPLRRFRVHARPANQETGEEFAGSLGLAHLELAAGEVSLVVTSDNAGPSETHRLRLAPGPNPALHVAVGGSQAKITVRLDASAWHRSPVSKVYALEADRAAQTIRSQDPVVDPVFEIGPLAANRAHRVETRSGRGALLWPPALEGIVLRPGENRGLTIELAAPAKLTWTEPTVRRLELTYLDHPDAPTVGFAPGLDGEPGEPWVEVVPGRCRIEADFEGSPYTVLVAESARLVSGGEHPLSNERPFGTATVRGFAGNIPLGWIRLESEML
ncbi:MAG: hypothetical protein ACYS22_18395, partial [Planctomycetota bacterium]